MITPTHLVSVEARACPLCGSSERNVLFRRREWDVVRCADCDMVFLGSEVSYGVQARDHDWVEEHGKELSRRQRTQPVWLFLSRCTRPLRPNTHDRLLSQTLRWGREGKLVDFGCGNGDFLMRAAKQFDVTGIELSPLGVEASRRRISAGRIIEGAVTEVAERILPAGAFDVVTQFGYIEHEWRPIAGLRAAHRLLKPGGVTVLKTPNYASWNRHVRGANWCGYHIPAHCNYFTPLTLAEMLRQAGLQPLPCNFLDRLPTSDSLWMAAKKLQS
jgi:2-polyprenyl-3-methyl-5-hydroxy-6-metoxy-1,4-benzoquinol methylase